MGKSIPLTLEHQKEKRMKVKAILKRINTEIRVHIVDGGNETCEYIAKAVPYCYINRNVRWIYPASAEGIVLELYEEEKNE